MRKHYALGTTRSASRIEQPDDVVILHYLVNALLHMRAFAHQIIIVDHVRRCLFSTVDDVFHRREGIASGGVRSEWFVDYQHLCFAIIENKYNFCACQADVQRHDDRSHARAGVIQFEVAMAVEHQYCHAISTHYAKSG